MILFLKNFEKNLKNYKKFILIIYIVEVVLVVNCYGIVIYVTLCS